MSATPDRRWIVSTETLLRGTLALMLGLGCVSFIEPSPYELFFFLLIPVALIAGLTITPTTLIIAVLAALAITAEVLALSPHFDHRKLEDGLSPSIYTVYSIYLWTSGVLFALIFSRQTKARVAIALKAYGVSCVFAGIWGVLSYLDVAGIGDREPILGRVAGPFKDPNVFGSYCVLGVMVFMQGAVIGPRRYRWLNLAGLLISLFGGVFLSFSRGSWGATIVATAFLVVSTYRTADWHAMRRRIVMSLVGIAAVAGIATAVVATNSTLSSTVTDRVQFEHDYDSGVTGRFGNQKRSIPILMANPLGYGPHRFPIYYGLDPHNSYINAFAAGGWLGGCTFLMIVLSTSWLALRLAFTPSPFLREAQVIAPALVSLFFQALQIDIDHWRFMFLMLGAVWGMEAARRRLIVSASPPPSSRVARSASPGPMRGMWLDRLRRGRGCACTMGAHGSRPCAARRPG